MIQLIDFIIALLLEYYLLLNASLSIRYSLFAGFFFATSFVVALFSYRAYEDENLIEYTEQFTRTLVSLIVAVILTALVFSIFRSKLAFKPTTLTVAILLFVIPFLNNKFYLILLSKRKPKQLIVLIQKSKLNILKNVFNELQEKSNGRYVFKAFVEVPEDLKSIDVFLSNCENEPIFVVSTSQEYEYLRNYFYSKQISHEITHLIEFVEDVLKRIPMELIEIYQQYYEIQFQKLKDSPVKRIFDFFLALIGIIVTFPLLIIAIMIVFIEDGTPVLFKQQRVGKHGKIFTFVKIRTLKHKRDNLVSTDPNEDIEKRALKVGKFLRLTRLDELPQFFLVLKGDMSIVGPRPEMVDYHEKYMSKIPYYNFRLSLKPGLTGWAQINYKHTSTLQEYIRKTEYDLYYVKNQSILLDLQIILQTLEAIFWRRGAR